MIEAQQSSRPIEQFFGKEKLQEKCGIVAVLSKKGENVSHLLVNMLEILKNRGEDAVGISAFDSATARINSHRGQGTADVVFEKVDFEDKGIASFAAIGHTRYTTEKSDLGMSSAAQPVVVGYNGRKLALAHNGNVPEVFRERLKEKIPSNLNGKPDLDSADITRAIVASPGDSWENKIYHALYDIPSAYSLTMLTDEGEIYGLAGPTDMWPLWAGENDDLIVFASETAAGEGLELDWQKVEPGNLVKATSQGVEITPLLDSTFRFRCGLQDEYVAHNESRMGYMAPVEIDGIIRSESYTHGQFRYSLGMELAKEHPIQADYYVGVPSTGMAIAEGYCDVIGKTPINLFKDKTQIEKIGSKRKRSYIAANKTQAETIAENKIQVRDDVDVEGKVIVLLEDSVIKGTVSSVSARKLYERGAKEVYILTILQPFTNDCDQGMVINKDYLVALEIDSNGNGRVRSNEEIAQIIKMTSFNTLSMEATRKVYEAGGINPEHLCFSCMGEPHPNTRGLIRDIYVADRPAKKVEIAA